MKSPVNPRILLLFTAGLNAVLLLPIPGIDDHFYGRAILIVNAVLALLSLFLWQFSLSKFLPRSDHSLIFSDPLKKLMTSVDLLKLENQDVEAAIGAIESTGEANFPEALSRVKTDRIASALQIANGRFAAFRKKEADDHWVAHGISAISAIKHRGSDITSYVKELTTAIVRYLDASQAGFFLLRKDEENTFFELTSAYAYGKQRFREKRINVGEGLIGQLYFEKEPVYITNVPADYVTITSGLGEALPRCICIMPLLWEGEIYGALEIASFTVLGSTKLEYLEKIAEIVAYNLGTIENARRTETLLCESRTMAAEMKAQDEELRQHMLELQQAQQEMHRRHQEMDAILATMSTLELDPDGSVIKANDIFLGLTGYSSSYLNGRAYKSLIPGDDNDTTQFEMMWSSILSGRSFSGEFRIRNSTGDIIWMAGNFTPIAGPDGRPYKIMLISLFTTHDKEKVMELQELVAAFKSCFPMAEINSDFTFRSASDLFLKTIGVRRGELRKTSPRQVFANGSSAKVERMLSDPATRTGSVELDIVDNAGQIVRFNSAIAKLAGQDEHNRKGLLILRYAV